MQSRLNWGSPVGNVKKPRPRMRREIAVHEVSYEVETGSRLRVIMHGYNSAYILGNTAVCLAAAGLIQRVAAGQAGPQRSLCVSASQWSWQAGSTKEDTVKGAEERRSALKRKVDRLL